MNKMERRLASHLARMLPTERARLARESERAAREFAAATGLEFVEAPEEPDPNLPVAVDDGVHRRLPWPMRCPLDHRRRT